MKKKAFTLIELIAVLVILAILALIVTPLVLNIIRKARVSADKRSIDAYGRSIELSIADYLLDKGTFPTSIEQLTIEYTGDKVECETTKLNSDSSVYLASCTVAGREVTGYTYGKEETIEYDYRVGNEVTYNNVEYYVLKDSTKTESTVTLLKKTPLTTAEVNEYGGVGTANNHVNMYSCSSGDSSCYQTAKDNNGYGGMAYYSSSTCRPALGQDNGDESGCTTSYDQSEIKYVVDAWKTAKAPLATEARLIKYDEIINSVELEKVETPTSPYYRVPSDTSWLYNSNYDQWTMSSYNDSMSSIWTVYSNGRLGADGVNGSGGKIVVRPVITIKKRAIN